uniref:Tr-type G domain-containing protein n=1 Tax=Meloidogyne javanica TaxID=6303 RepID=A0A915M430_MELJA
MPNFQFLQQHRLFSTETKIEKFTENVLLKSLNKYTPDKIRNFAIIAHIDHGKSTLSDRLLQLTNVIPSDSEQRYLDKLEVEKERGITVSYFESQIFSFEVKRSLVACGGAILLVAANQGIQAQTIFNFWDAFQAELSIIPIINKIDMALVDIDRIEKQMQTLFDFKKEEILKVSAKTGLNVPSILDAIIERIPPPNFEMKEEKSFQAHIFDSWFDHRCGVVLLLVVKHGQLKRGMSVQFFNDKERIYNVKQVGFLHPEMVPCESLTTGQVGYMFCGIKSPKDIIVGDTLFEAGNKIDLQPFMSINKIKPTVYAGLFPTESSEFERLNKAVENLCLNDSSVEIETDSSAIFGQAKYGELAVFTSPTVEYLADIVNNESIRQKRYGGKEQIVISKPSSFPSCPTDIVCFHEPVSLVSIVTPAEYFQLINSLCENARGENIETMYIDETKMLLKWSGYASFDMKDDGYRECKLEKICIYLNDKQIEELSLICPSVIARKRANQMINKLKNEIPSQQIEVTIRASFGTSRKAVAQAIIKPMKKDFAGVLKGK